MVIEFLLARKLNLNKPCYGCKGGFGEGEYGEPYLSFYRCAMFATVNRSYRQARQK